MKSLINKRCLLVVAFVCIVAMLLIACSNNIGNGEFIEQREVSELVYEDTVQDRTQVWLDGKWIWTTTTRTVQYTAKEITVNIYEKAIEIVGGKTIKKDKVISIVYKDIAAPT